MRKVLMVLILATILVMPVSAMEYTAPTAPSDALKLIPTESSGFAEDLWYVILSALPSVQPAVAEAIGLCAGIFGSVILVALLKTLPGRGAEVTELAAVLGVAAMLFGTTKSMVSLAAETVAELSEYGKLLLPVLAAALASQGGVTSSTALYTGTVVFDALLSSGIKNLLVPLVYIFLILSLAAGATGEGILNKLKDFVKWLVTWCLKMILYIFTGYISITGVVSGTTDAAALRATKLTVSGMVPVVGGILSDASEAVIVSAGVMKSAVGVYGLIAVIAIWITPFLQIGIQYLLLKLTAALCAMFACNAVNGLIQAFTAAMGLLLAMTGTVCVLLLISTVCFMKGVS